MEAVIKDLDYKVSIITVVYNGAKTIEQTIQSVLNQTYKNIEYIIIDGQSTDGTVEIIKKYIDSINYFVSEKDNGIYDAMNKGICIANGDIIGIINSDDWYVEDAVEKIAHCFNQQKADLVYGKVCFIDENGDEKVNPNFPLDMLWYRTVVYHPSVFIRKEVYQKYGFYNLKYKISADYELLLRLYSVQVQFWFIDIVIAYFRLGGLSTVKQNESIEEHREISLKYIEESKNKYKFLELHREWYSWARFSVDIRKERLLCKLLCKCFQIKISEVIIFGTGKWGKDCYEILTEENIVVELFLDNDSTKWNQLFCGVKIVDPQEICDQERYILIAVRNDGERIKNQLKAFNNEKLKYVSLAELVDLYK